ncbi:MAG: class I SAM-dependent methyltransferase [Solirubrobacterales bacterium]|nr:class I SAM-dependent methyltransferase [Solirubrobacterales bacterium]
MSDAAPGPAALIDLHAWQVLSPLIVAGGYLPWTSGSMRPAALVAVCNEIVHGARSRIVECGSGAGTVLLARLLRERGGGELTALEHDAHWAELVVDRLRRESLDTLAQVVHAPLEGEPPWYASAALDSVPDEVDLLLVDGPPACDPGHGTRRAPALSEFASRLVAGAAVIVDDVDRPGEREVIAGWEASSTWRFDLDHLAGVAVGRRPA